MHGAEGEIPLASHSEEGQHVEEQLVCNHGRVRESSRWSTQYGDCGAGHYWPAVWQACSAERRIQLYHEAVPLSNTSSVKRSFRKSCTMTK